MKEDDEKWLEFYKKAQAEKNLHAEIAWKTVEFHIVLSSSLVSITVGALVLVQTSDIFAKLNQLMRAMLTGMLLIIPLIMYFILRVGSSNFRRECERMYEHLTVMMKIEEKLGFLDKRSEKKQFPEDDKYFPNVERYSRPSESRDTSDFIGKQMSGKDGYYGTVKRIFTIFKMASLVLILLIVGLLLSVGCLG